MDRRVALIEFDFAGRITRSVMYASVSAAISFLQTREHGGFGVQHLRRFVSVRGGVKFVSLCRHASVV